MIRFLLFVLTLAYVIPLAGLLIALNWWGERHWLLSLVLLIPPWLLLAPLLILSPLSVLLLRWRLVLLQLGCVAAVSFGYMTFRWTPEPSAFPGSLTLVTHNVGEGNKQQFEAFLNEVDPEIVLLQDAQFRAPAYARRFPSHHVIAQGEFICISKYPIQKAALLKTPRSSNRPVAARFEVIFQGKPVALYNVHMPSPRQELNRVISWKTITGLFGANDSHLLGNYQDWLATRIELARDLSRTIEAERLPYLAAGDFNMPDHGYIYGLFAGSMSDAFAKAGRGFGFTFPGGSSAPAAFFGPWLRIDYVFAGKGWEPLFCVPEPGNRSQHRAVMARLRPVARS